MRALKLPESEELTSANAVARTGMVVVGLAAGLAVSCPRSSNLSWTGIGLPYVWRDVLLVYLLSALPGALLVAYRKRRIDSRWQLAGEIIVLLVMTAALMILICDFPVPTVATNPWIVRTAMAFLLALLLSLGVAAVSRQRHQWHQKSSGWMYAGVAGMTLLVLPAIYVEARSQHDADQMMELVDQMRFGEARAAAGQLLKLNPGITLRNGQRLSDLVARLEMLVQELEARIGTKLPSDSPLSESLERAEVFAMLGKADEAVSLLEALPDSNPAKNNLLATLWENSGAWTKARDQYSRARIGWQAAAPSPERRAGFMQACQGLGYCERKLGNVAAAEAAYLELLRASPSAENHFLLAQFYEDTQQAPQAYRHASTAIKLNPQRFRDDSQKLIDKLVTSHFGCLSSAYVD